MNIPKSGNFNGAQGARNAKMLIERRVESEGVSTPLLQFYFIFNYWISK